MKEGTFNRGLLNQVPVAFGTLIYLICGIAVSVVASKSLSADDYVNYSAFVSVGGIFVLGVGAAIEQETNLVYFRLNGNSGATWRYMIPRVTFAVLVLWILFLSPFFSWQSHLFGNSSTEVQLSIAFGAPGLLLAGVMKGIVNGRAEFRRLALSHIIFGLGTISLPIIIWSYGISMSIALVVGQAIAWSTPVLILFRTSSCSNSELQTDKSTTSNLSGWLVLANIALLTNLLSSQLIFRLHSPSLSSTVVAEAQVLITVSCFASTLAMGLMPQIIANHRSSSGAISKRPLMMKRSVLLIASLLALGAAFFRRIISLVLLPRESTIPFFDALLITTPAVFLVLALLTSGKLIADEKVKQAATSWSIGLVGLWVFPELFGSETLRSLSIALFVGATIAPVSFSLIEYMQRRRSNQI